MTKIVQTVDSCLNCPNRSYYSGGVYRCEKKPGYNDLPEDHRQRVPSWCPLPDYPAGVDVPGEGKR